MQPGVKTILLTGSAAIAVSWGMYFLLKVAGVTDPYTINLYCMAMFALSWPCTYFIYSRGDKGDKDETPRT